MGRKTVLGIMLTLLFMGILTSAFNSAITEASTIKPFYASPAEIHVYPGGSIQAAINAANPGDSIIVHEGTYSENVDVNKAVNLLTEGLVTVNASDPNDHVFHVTASYANITGFTATGFTGPEWAKIYLDTVSHCKISNNNASNNYYLGILLRYSSYNTLVNNTANSNDGWGFGFGIRLHYSSNNILVNNTANSNQGTGIYLDWSSNYNILVNNTANLNMVVGIYLDWSTEHNLLVGNTANSNGKGIYLFSSSNNTLVNNTANSNSHGIYLAGSSNNTLANNTVNSDYVGIYLEGLSNNTLVDNTASLNHIGIFLGGYNNTVVNNIADLNEYGIYLGCSNNNTVVNNFAHSNSEGIYLYHASNNTLVNNTANSNTNWGINLYSSNNNTLDNNTANWNQRGMWLDNSNTNVLVNNTANLNRIGIFLEWSSRNTLVNTTSNSNREGITLANSSNYNILINSTANSNDDYGITIWNSSDNTFINNVANSNNIGIYLYSHSNNNMLIHNSMSENDYGISLAANSSYNLIYHSNLINNNVNGYDENPGSNYWYDPIFLEGNYWSDYEGLDDGSGIGKHATAGDGIGDTLIPHPATGYDYYPFVEPVDIEVISGRNPTVFDLKPPNGSLIGDPTPTISAVLADVLPGIDPSTIVLKVDETIMAHIYNPSIGVVSYTPASNLTEGIHTVTVEVSDLAGNGPSNASWSFSIDTVPPDVAINPVISPTNMTTQTITGTFNEANIDRILVNGENATLDKAAGTYSANVTLVWGENLINVTAADLAGNTATVTGTIVRTKGVWYRYESEHFETLIPPEFTYELEDGDLFLCGPTKDGFTITINVVLRSNPEVKETETYLLNTADLAIKGLSSQYADFRGVQPPRCITINGRGAVTYVFQFSIAEGVTVIMKQAIIVSDELNYFAVITAAALARDYNEYEPTFNATIESFRFSALSWKIVGYTMCKDIANGKPVGNTTTFSTRDDRANLWVNFTDLYESHRVKFEWYYPNGILYREFSIDTVAPAPGQYWKVYPTWGFMGIRGQPPSQNPGNWTVKLYVDDDLQFQAIFKIQAPPLTFFEKFSLWVSLVSVVAMLAPTPLALKRRRPLLPTAPTPVFEYVGVLRRLVASIIDEVILSTVSTALGWYVILPTLMAMFPTLMTVGTITLTSLEEVTLVLQLILAYVGIVALITLVYQSLMEGYMGATIGKMALRIRVVSEDGGRCGLGSAYLRHLLDYVDAVPYLIPCLVGVIKIRKSPKKQRLGDKVARTVVIKKGVPAPAMPLPTPSPKLFCSQCGKEVSPESNLCPFCGAKILRQKETG